MKNIIKTALFAMTMVGFIACGDDDSGTSQPSVRVNFKTINTVSGIPANGRVEANSLQFTSGTITLTQIQFQAETDEGDSVEVNYEGTVVVDFSTGATTPDLSALGFPAGSYVEMEVELELLDENNVPSVVIEGTFTDRQDQTHPIRFEFNSGETFEVEKEGNITFATGTSAIAEVTFDPGVWFAGVTSSMLEEATKNNAGVIVVSETSNVEIFDIVADGLDLATEIELKL